MEPNTIALLHRWSTLQPDRCLFRQDGERAYVHLVEDFDDFLDIEWELKSGQVLNAVLNAIEAYPLKYRLANDERGTTFATVTDRDRRFIHHMANDRVEALLGCWVRWLEKFATPAELAAAATAKVQ